MAKATRSPARQQRPRIGRENPAPFYESHGALSTETAEAMARPASHGLVRACVRCSRFFKALHATDPAILCGDCLPKEFTRRDCPRCGGPKPKAKGRHLRVLCRSCAYERRNASSRLKHQEQRRRMHGEQVERETATLPVEDYDPKATFKAGQKPQGA